MNAREEFWKGDFGNEYNRRSPGDPEANYHFFKRALFGCHFESAVELGAGTGANLRALHRLRPTADLAAVEINRDACLTLAGVENLREIIGISILDWKPKRQWDLAMTKGVLIHVAPDDLPTAYEALWQASSRFIFVAEYFSPKPVEIEYRGHAGKLWKRDFAGDLLDRYPLKVIDYGFCWSRDKRAPQDDLTWFVMEKQQ